MVRDKESVDIKAKSTPSNVINKSSFCICLHGKADKNQFEKIRKQIDKIKKAAVLSDFTPSKKIPIKAPFYHAYFMSKPSLSHTALSFQINESSKNIDTFMKKIKSMKDEWAISLVNEVFSNPPKSVMKDSPSFFFSVDIQNENLLKGDTIDLSFFDQIKTINSLISLLGEKGEEPSGYVCSSMYFPSSEFNLANNLSLPIDFHLPAKLDSSVGNSSLVGFDFEFENSAKGLETASISYSKRKKAYHISLRIKYRVDNFDEYIKNNISLAIDVANQFIEGKSK